MLPTGCASDDFYEVCQASMHRELQWSHLSPERKAKYQEAADTQWKTWLDNNALKVLSMSESRAI